MLIDCETLQEIVAYDPQTGALTWKHRPRELFDKEGTFKAWNGRYSGRPALVAKHPQGYRHGALFGRFVLAHRAAWAIVHGKWPSDEIDHINGNRADNRLQNLRAVSCAENHKNLRPHSRNKSGVTGVFYNPQTRKWRATISTSHIGEFEAKDDAIAARKAAEAAKGYHPNHGKIV